ncbi:hypothetical protein ACW73L_14775 [Methylolobus aquaticus]
MAVLPVWTFRSIALGPLRCLPRERVRQLQNAALKELKQRAEEQGYDADLLFH